MKRLNLKHLNKNTEFAKDLSPTSRLIGGYSGRIGGLMTKKLVEIGEKQLIDGK
ncbi:small, acid-soluble spore protein, alpha/beta type [Clostridiaceae bacterium M8S5]|nr:small, acid-soluble spore protein, alpha/beta type [Clostridiaceae bacterium M8S5]